MTARHGLPRVITWLVGRVAGRAPEVVGDLAEDYARMRRARGPGRARWWLARETASLVGAYLSSPLGRLKRQLPLVGRDLTMVARGLARRPLAAIGGAALLATGLLAVVVTAGLAEVLLHRPVSGPHGDAVRRVAAFDREGDARLRFSWVEFEAIRDRVSDAELAAVNLQPVLVRLAGGAHVQTLGEVVTRGYLPLIGDAMLGGRPLLSADHDPASPPAVVVSAPFWRTHLAGSPAAVGQTLRLNGHAFTIAGVARAQGSSGFLGASVDVWVSEAHADALLNPGWRVKPADRWWSVFVHPGPGGLAAVDTALAQAREVLARDLPDPWHTRRLGTVPGTLLAGSLQDAATMLAAVLGGLALLILAVAAANLGGVFLARGAAERRQAAIHLSLGSGRAALVRRRVIEGTLVGTLAGAIAIGGYMWARTALAEIALQPTLTLRLDLPFDARLALMTLAVAALAGLALSLGPALWSTRLRLAPLLAGGATRAAGAEDVSRARRWLVSAQVALSLTLIVGAALFTQTLAALAAADVGFPRAGLVAVDFDVEPTGPAMMAGGVDALARQALERARALPGVSAAAMANRAPIDPSTPGAAVHRPGEDRPAVADASLSEITSGYFETVGIPIQAGRAFTPEEFEAGAPVVIVNESLARRLWPDAHATDRLIRLEPDGETRRVVGVARDARYRAIAETDHPHLYVPTPPRFGLALLARTQGDERQTLRALQAALDEVGPGLVGFFPRTLEDHLGLELLPARAVSRAALGLGTLALLLSVVGLYGLVGWFVELRRREIGVRMALGARPADVRRLVVRQALAAAAPGLGAGLVLTGVLAMAVRSMLYGVGPLDPQAFAAGVVVLLAAVAAASYFPGRRATRVDPAVTLRDV